MVIFAPLSACRPPRRMLSKPPDGTAAPIYDPMEDRGAVPLRGNSSRDVDTRLRSGGRHDSPRHGMGPPATPQHGVPSDCCTPRAGHLRIPERVRAAEGAGARDALRGPLF